MNRMEYDVLIPLPKCTALPQDEPYHPFIFIDLLNVLGALEQHNYSLELRRTIYMEVNQAAALFAVRHLVSDLGSVADVRGIVFYQQLQ